MLKKILHQNTGLNIILLLINAFGLIWIGVGAYYSYPNAEDLMEAASSRDIGVFNRLIESLQIVDGRYTTNLLHGLNPLAFNYYYGYKIVPIITFLLLFAGVYFLLKELFKEEKNNLIHALSLVVFFLSGMNLGSSFFWMICSFVYIYPIIFILFFFNSFIRYVRTRGVKYFFFSLLFIFLTIGTCEVSIFIFGGIFICLFHNYRKNSEIKKALFLAALVYVFSVVLLLSAPGISMRSSHYESSRINEWSSIFKLSFKNSVEAFMNLKLIPLLLYLILFVNIYFKKSISQKITVPVLVGLGTIFGICFVVIYAKGEQGFSSQITTFPISISIVVLILLIQKLISYFKLSRISQLILLLFIGFFTFTNSSFSLIQKDFTSNKLTRFKEEMDLQYHTLSRQTQCDSAFISVYSINDIVGSLPKSVTDSPVKYISKNRLDVGGNRSYEKYFKIDEVNLQTDTIKVLNKINEIINH